MYEIFDEYKYKFNLFDKVVYNYILLYIDIYFCFIYFIFSLLDYVFINVCLGLLILY